MAMANRRNIRARGDVYSCAGMGYTWEQALRKKQIIEDERKSDHVTIDMNVRIIPMGDGKFKVQDDSTYEARIYV